MISESYDDPEKYGGPGDSGPGSLSHDRIVEAAIDFVDHNGPSSLKPAPSTTTPLTRYRRTLGDDHPATLKAADNLARDLRALGEHEQARILHEQIASWRHRREPTG